MSPVRGELECIGINIIQNPLHLCIIKPTNQFRTLVFDCKINRTILGQFFECRTYISHKFHQIGLTQLQTLTSHLQFPKVKQLID